MAWYMLMRIFFFGDAIVVTHATTDIIVYVSFQAFTQVGGSWWDTGVLVGFLVPTLTRWRRFVFPERVTQARRIT